MSGTRRPHSFAVISKRTANSVTQIRNSEQPLPTRSLTGKLHHLKLDVNDSVVRTYIDGKLVDTYEDHSGRLHNGSSVSARSTTRLWTKKACFDNIKVTTFDDGQTGEQGTVTFTEDFEGSGHDFTDGVVIRKAGNRMLCVSSTYEENCTMQNPQQQGIPLFRKAFSVKGAMKSAKIYASALGVFDLFMNGSRVGQTEADGTVRYDELKPGWTDYRKEINYMTYDVTSLVREGSNVIGAQVSNGWWGGAIAHGVYGTPSLGFIAKLRIEYEDGRVENVVTGTDWTCSTSGPVTLRMTSTMARLMTHAAKATGPHRNTMRRHGFLVWKTPISTVKSRLLQGSPYVSASSFDARRKRLRCMKVPNPAAPLTVQSTLSAAWKAPHRFR